MADSSIIPKGRAEREGVSPAQGRHGAPVAHQGSPPSTRGKGGEAHRLPVAARKTADAARIASTQAPLKLNKSGSCSGPAVEVTKSRLAAGTGRLSQMPGGASQGNQVPHPQVSKLSAGRHSTTASVVKGNGEGDGGHPPGGKSGFAGPIKSSASQGAASGAGGGSQKPRPEATGKGDFALQVSEWITVFSQGGTKCTCLLRCIVDSDWSRRCRSKSLL